MNVPQINYEALEKEHWSNEEIQNVKLVVDFIQHLMNEHDFDYVSQKFDNSSYIQHNRQIPNGISGLITYVQGIVKRFPDYAYDVKHIYADGDYIVFHSHATANRKDRGNDKKGFNIMDSWKIEDGQIVEHWDSLQPMNSFMRFYYWLTGGKIRNTNGVY